MKRRITILLVSLLVLAGFAAISDTATTSALQWYLHFYTRSQLDAKLSYDSFTKHDHTWIIKNPRLIQEDTTIFSAEQLDLQVGLSPFNRTVDIDLTLTSPTFTLGEHYQKAIKIATNRTAHFRILNINQHIVATNGRLYFHSNDTITPLSFSVDATLGPLSHGTAQITPMHSEKNQAKLEATLSQEFEGPQLLEVTINKMPVAPLTELLRLYFPILPALTVKTGETTGLLHLEFPKRKLTEAKGDMVVNNFYATDDTNEYTVLAPEITLKLASESTGKGQQLVPTAGHVDISQGATIALKKEGQPFWSFDNIIGTFSFENNEGGDFTFDSDSTNHDKHRKLHLEGHLHFLESNETTLSFKTSLNREEHSFNDLTAHVSLRHLAEQWDLGEIEVNGFTHEEFNLFKHLASKRFPKVNQFQLNDGIFDAAMIVYLDNLQPSEVRFEKIQARNVAFSLDNWELQGSASNITGSASVDLTMQEPILTLNADLNITHGKATIPGPRGEPWHFTDIDSEFNVREGIIQQTSLEGTFAGMHAKMILDGTNPDSLVKITMVGSTDDLAPYTSKNLKKTLERNFANNQVRIEALGKAVSSALDVSGMITFNEKNRDDKPIHFSFELDRMDHISKEKKPPHHIVSEYLTKASMQAITSLLPNSDLPAKEKKTKKVIDPSWTLFGYTMKEGRFEASELCIDKYLSPFLFTEDQMTMCGIGAFYGIFNLHAVKVDYDASDLVLKNDDFVIEIKKICHQDGLCTPTIASQYFDFDEGKGYGTLPVRGGSYFEKNSGLLFTDIDALIFLQHDKAHITELSTFCNGIHFGGNIEVDWSMPGKGVFEVDVHIAEMDGRVSQMQHFFSHFNQPFFFLKLPLEGNIALRNKGAHLHFNFEADDFQLESIIEGMIADGVVNSPELDMIVNDISMNFSYDHQKSLMDISDLQATLLVGSAKHFEEYQVAGDGIRFTDFKNNESHFDVWIADKSRDIFRIVGKTYSDRNSNEEPIVKVDIDKSLSHFGVLYPKEFELVLDPSSTPLVFHLDFNFTLDDLLTDLQKFSRTGLLFLSRNILKELNGIKNAEGSLSGSINYLKSLASLEYQIHGNAIKIDDHSIDIFELAGNKRGDLWSIEQLQIDKIALSLDIHKDPDLWNINFLGARFGSSVLIGMEGVYIPDEDRLKAKINLCEIDLKALHEWPAIESFIKENRIQGNLKANGSLEIAFDKTLPEMGMINLQATGSLSKGQFDVFSFDDMQNVTLKYNSNSGLTIDKIQTIISSIENEEPRTGIYLNSANFNFNTSDFAVNGLHFNVPSHQLGWLARHLEDRYPTIFSSTVIDLISNLKSSGSVEGNISAAVVQGQKGLRIALNNDIYHWADSKYDLRNVVIDYNPHLLKLTGKFVHENTLLNIIATAEAPEYTHGLVTVFEDRQQQQPQGQAPSPLTIYWNSATSDGFSISKIQGYLCGISVDLVNDIEFPLNPHYHHLVGTVNFDLTNATRLLTSEQAASIAAAQLGQGYALYGRFALDKSTGKSFGDRLYFQGDLLGSSFTCYGYRLSYLTAQLDYQPNQARLTNLSISDACGQIHIPTIDLVVGSDTRWHAAIPQVTIKDLRPSSMESLTPTPSKIKKSITFRQMEINNLQGILGNRNSFTGTGKLNFVNPQKKNFEDTIFAIPAELLTRIGLDLGVLTPIRGNIDFDVSDGKIFLRKFKDVYSKKKVSKFQLANTGYQSYIDFDGNVHVQIKMKQYNLVFKLAELFTVTIGGTVHKPTYSLQKQGKGDFNG